LNIGVEPAASETIIVSPTAREAARIIDAAIPEIAAGKTTLIAVSNFVTQAGQLKKSSSIHQVQILAHMTTSMKLSWKMLIL